MQRYAMMGVGASALGALSYWICNGQQSKAELPEDLDWEQVILVLFSAQEQENYMSIQVPPILHFKINKHIRLVARFPMQLRFYIASWSHKTHFLPRGIGICICYILYIECVGLSSLGC